MLVVYTAEEKVTLVTFVDTLAVLAHYCMIGLFYKTAAGQKKKRSELHCQLNRRQTKHVFFTDDKNFCVKLKPAVSEQNSVVWSSVVTVDLLSERGT